MTVRVREYFSFSEAFLCCLYDDVIRDTRGNIYLCHRMIDIKLEAKNHRTTEHAEKRFGSQNSDF